MLALAGVAALGGAAAGVADAAETVIDLTYPFDEHTIYWPTARSFTLERVAHGPSPQGFWYEANNFCAAEHGGTHIDAPCHFGKGRTTVDSIPLERLMGPVAVVDVHEACAKDPDYRVSVQDLRAHESSYGRIPDGTIVLVFTGWGARWPDRKRYLGDDRPGEVSNLHFPGFSREAAEFLVHERHVHAVGLDTPSLDHGPSRDFIAHQIFNGADVPGLENVASLDKLPPRGATLYALPMKIRGGSGAPARIFAVVPQASPGTAPGEKRRGGGP